MLYQILFESIAKDLESRFRLSFEKGITEVEQQISTHGNGTIGNGLRIKTTNPKISYDRFSVTEVGAAVMVEVAANIGLSVSLK